jgi:membrane fusion protein (multidrug efflux system)
MHKQNRNRVITISALLAAAMMLTACGGPAPSQQMPAPEVSVIAVKTERVELTMELPGRTSAHFVAEVRPQVNGIVQKRLFTEGSYVQAGQVLYQIDPAMYQAAFDSANASLSRAEANLTTTRLKAGRYKELIAVNAVSRQEYDDMVAALKQAESDVAGNKAAVEAARINLAYSSVKAPITGRIGKSSVTDGALVTANQPAALAVIQQLDPMYVDVTQSSADLLRLKQEMASGKLKKDGANQAKVKLILENGAPYPQTGVLKFSDVTVDQSTGSVTLRSLFPNRQNILLPGMFVRAVVEEGVNDKAILVSQQAVTRDPQGNAVCMVVNSSEKVEPRVLKAERAIGDKWLVSDGLKPGDRVIMEGLMKVRPGMPVKAVPFGAAPPAAPAAADAKQPGAAK